MTKRFTDFIQDKDAVSFKDAFEESVSAKIFTALEAKKVEVAKGMFDEHGNDGFGSVKTSGKWPMPNHPGQGLPKTKEHKMEEEKMCPHCEMSMSKCKCDHMEEEVGLDEGMHKHEKKHGKMHHKLTKKMMKLAHKHAMNETSEEHHDVSMYPHFHEFAAGALHANSLPNKKEAHAEAGKTKIPPRLVKHVKKAEEGLRRAKEDGMNLHAAGGSADGGDDDHEGHSIPRHALHALEKLYY